MTPGSADLRTKLPLLGASALQAAAAAMGILAFHWSAYEYCLVVWIDLGFAGMVYIGIGYMLAKTGKTPDGESPAEVWALLALALFLFAYFISAPFVLAASGPNFEYRFGGERNGLFTAPLVAISDSIARGSVMLAVAFSFVVRLAQYVGFVLRGDRGGWNTVQFLFQPLVSTGLLVVLVLTAVLLSGEGNAMHVGLLVCVTIKTGYDYVAARWIHRPQAAGLPDNS